MNQLNHRQIVRAGIAALFSVICGMLWISSYASDAPEPGNRYTIVGPLYLRGIYLDLNDRRVSLASLSSVLVSGPEVAFQQMVSIGTTMIIVGPAPKRLPLPFYANRYFVRLDPEPKDLPNEIDIVFELNRGNEGSLDGLNPDLFSRTQ